MSSSATPSCLIIIIVIIKIIIVITIIIIHLYSAFSTRFKGAVYKELALKLAA